MKKLEYWDESTVIKEEIEFSDEHYDLTKNLHKQYESELLSKCTPIMVRNDKQSLVFCVNLGDRKEDRMYKVIIEKIAI